MPDASAPAPAPRSWKSSLIRLQGQLMRGREARGLKQIELAEKIGVSRSTFQRWEAGSDTTIPNINQFFYWAHRGGPRKSDQGLEWIA